jgi:ribA/ribD-fused uncharacterized protein
MTADDCRTREDLLRLVRKGTRPHFLFFWGHRPLSTGEIGSSCLSQWWPSPFNVGSITYSTAEHFMMSEKARLFGDEDVRTQILKTGSPKTAKQLGRQISNFDEDVWQASRFQYVVEGNQQKFSQNRELGRFLLGTGNKVLVEASPVDRIWGIGLAADDEQAMNPERWRGLNLLGFALMEVRHRLREEQ